MEIQIIISDVAAENIQSQEHGRPIEDVVGELVETRYANGADMRADRPPYKFSDFAGLVSGGPTDIAERASEILRAEIGSSGLGSE